MPITADGDYESDETFSVVLTGASGASITDSMGVGTIGNDDSSSGPMPAVTINDVSVAEGTGSVSNSAVFTVSLTPAAAQDVIVGYQTQNGNATAGSDYTYTTGSLTISAGQTSAQITVPITADGDYELDETFSVVLSGASGASITDGTGIGTIGNDDSSSAPMPAVTINDVSVAEGTGSVTNSAVFTVNLSSVAAQDVIIGYQTQNGTATSGSDYTYTSGSVTISAGQSSAQITVPITPDSDYESDETFSVVLTGASGASITDSTGVGTIGNDDNSSSPMPAVTINDVSVAEGTGSVSNSAVFTVSLSSITTADVVITYYTIDGTATSGSDYTYTSGSVTISAGQSSAQITVPITPDSDYESDETFSVYLTGSSYASITDFYGVATIANDDSPPTISVLGDGYVLEGEAANFKLRLSAESSESVTVYYSTSDGTAQSGSDYSSALGSVVFSPGETEKLIPVSTIDDSADEPDETFSLSITSAIGASVGASASTISIVDNDSYFQILGSQVSEPDDEESTTSLAFDISFTDPGNNGGSVAWRVVSLYEPGEATPGEDYDGLSLEGVVNFSPGGGTSTVYLPVLFDLIDEPDETVRVFLYNPSSGSVVDSEYSEATGTISNTSVSVAVPFSAALSAEAGVGSIDEGETFYLRGQVYVSEGEYPAQVAIYNETTEEELGTADVDSEDGTFEWSYVFTDDDPTGTSEDTYSLTISATAGQAEIDDTVIVTVRNVAPEVAFQIVDAAPPYVPIDAIGDGGTIAIDIAEPTDPGTEPLTISIDWGDGDTEPVTLQPNESWPVRRFHTYASRPNDPADSNHTYRIRVTVGDDDGGSTTVESAILATKGSPSKPVVSIEATDAEADEVFQRTGTFKISRGTDDEGDLAVKLVPTHGSSPVAAAGDYQLFLSDGSELSNSGWFSTFYVVTIPDGQKEIEVTLRPKNDGAKEGDESLQLTVSEYYNPSDTPYNISSVDDAATVTIKDGWGRVTFRTIGTGEVEEDANVGWFNAFNGINFEATFWGTYDHVLYLPVTFTGDAEAGVDYLSPSTDVYMYLGSTSMVGTVLVKPKADLKIEGSESITIGLQSGFTLSSTAIVTDSTAATATGYITDDDVGREFTIEARVVSALSSTPYVDFTGGTYGFSETQSASNLELRIKRSSNASSALKQSVMLEFGGDATIGADYKVFSLVQYPTLRIEFGPGVLEANVFLTILDDAGLESLETIDVKVVPDSLQGSEASGQIQIADNDTTVTPQYTEVWRSDFEGDDYDPWVYVNYYQSWVRFTQVKELVPESGPLAITSSNGAPLLPGKSLGYSLSSSETRTFQVGGGGEYKAFNVTASLGVEYSTERSLQLSVDYPANGIAGIPEKRFYVVPLAKKVRIFEQRVYDPSGEHKPAEDEAGNSAVTAQIEHYIKTPWGELRQDQGMEAIIYVR